METTEAQPQYGPIPDSVARACPKCHRIFKNAMALRMHDLRKHSGRGWNTSGNFRKNKSREHILQSKREYNKRLRERYYREGKNSRGEQMPAGWKPRSHGKGGGNAGMKLPHWSKERRAKFNSTWRGKNKVRAKKERIQIVYPDPREKTTPEPVPMSVLRYCPNCGEHLSKWRAG